MKVWARVVSIIQFTSIILSVLMSLNISIFPYVTLGTICEQILNCSKKAQLFILYTIYSTSHPNFHALFQAFFFSTLCIILNETDVKENKIKMSIFFLQYYKSVFHAHCRNYMYTPCHTNVIYTNNNSGSIKGDDRKLTDPSVGRF